MVEVQTLNKNESAAHDVHVAIPIVSVSSEYDPGLIGHVDPTIVKIAKMSKSVLVFATIDCVLWLFYLVYSIAYVIPIICSVFGYYGANKYKACPLYVYFTYHLLFGVGKVMIIFVPAKTGLVVLSVISGCLELYISRFTYKVAHSISNLDQDQKLRLNNLRRTQLAIVYW